MNKLKNLFRGRLNRWQYFWGIVLARIIFYSLVAITFASVIPDRTSGSKFLGILLLMCFIYALDKTFFVSLNIRRLHDINSSGYWALLGIVPIINIILFVYLLVHRGYNGANAYGLEPPKSPIFNFIFGIYPSGYLEPVNIAKTKLSILLKVPLWLMAAIGILLYLMVIFTTTARNIYPSLQ